MNGLVCFRQHDNNFSSSKHIFSPDDQQSDWSIWKGRMGARGGGRVWCVAVAVDDAVRYRRMLQRHVIGRLGGCRRQRHIRRRPRGAADRAYCVRRVAARQPQGPQCEGFFVMIWIAAVMFKSNDILHKQTALKIQWSGKLLYGGQVCAT
ncbi:uncharacterized protein LOC119341446 isoform X1 [Triticum dicoccoides]|uniref:uncharacterized protein LOC119341446 isoform X1 n=1 Tax=Triticum dicoccoides TaxID=85692 RepID=UPI0018919CFF|nr:uncharacterized protein LOC119341446 isoform X1 [Triticum dicoccoides]XP_037469216.1 uncharacterized protein LOC119341446 isoform X1 [Triticum dicoccoides]XP_037469217.1 uncharacterized protein LOC119341446 isoform X1 [Triticum dicoccoides]